MCTIVHVYKLYGTVFISVHFGYCTCSEYFTSAGTFFAWSNTYFDRVFMVPLMIRSRYQTKAQCRHLTQLPPAFIPFLSLSCHLTSVTPPKWEQQTNKKKIGENFLVFCIRNTAEGTRREVIYMRTDFLIN
jgi:hypothetical protein